jgi:hypothetical protein
MMNDTTSPDSTNPLLVRTLVRARSYIGVRVMITYASSVLSLVVVSVEVVVIATLLVAWSPLFP